MCLRFRGYLVKSKIKNVFYRVVVGLWCNIIISLEKNLIRILVFIIRYIVSYDL